MEPTRRERIVLFGAVPIIAALLGAVATVVVARLTDGGSPNEVILEIVRDPNLSFAQKEKLLKLANHSTDRFYAWLTGVGVIVAMFVGAVGPSIAERIRRR